MRVIVTTTVELESEIGEPRELHRLTTGGSSGNPSFIAHMFRDLSTDLTAQLDRLIVDRHGDR